MISAVYMVVHRVVMTSMALKTVAIRLCHLSLAEMTTLVLGAVREQTQQADDARASKTLSCTTPPPVGHDLS